MVEKKRGRSSRMGRSLFRFIKGGDRHRLGLWAEIIFVIYLIISSIISRLGSVKFNFRRTRIV